MWHHADGESPSWQLEDEPEIKSGEWKKVARFERTVYGHIQDISENGADVGHFGHLHKATPFLTGDEYSRRGDQSWKRLLGSQLYTTTWNCEGVMAHTPVEIKPFLFTWEPKWGVIKGCFRLWGPALFVFRVETALGKFLTVMSMTPVGPLKVHIVHIMFAEPKLPWVAIRLLDFGLRNMVS